MTTAPTQPRLPRELQVPENLRTTASVPAGDTDGRRGKADRDVASRAEQLRRKIAEREGKRK